MVPAKMTCPVCQTRPADSVEHVIPQRLVRDVFGPGPHVFQRRHGPLEIDGNVRPKAVKLEICGDCNNTFLNQQFEQPFASEVVALARSQVAILNPDVSADIGRYLFKTFLLMEIARRPIRVNPTDVTHFSTTAEPPEGWAVWMFRAQRSPLRERGVDPGRVSLPAEHGVLGLARGSSAAQSVIGALGWVVTDPKSSLVQAILAEYEKHGHVAQVWPRRTTDLDWPTSVLSPAGYRRLIQPQAAIDIC